MSYVRHYEIYISFARGGKSYEARRKHQKSMPTNFWDTAALTSKMICFVPNILGLIPFFALTSSAISLSQIPSPTRLLVLDGGSDAPRGLGTYGFLMSGPLSTPGANITQYSLGPTGVQGEFLNLFARGMALDRDEKKV